MQACQPFVTVSLQTSIARSADICVNEVCVNEVSTCAGPSGSSVREISKQTGADIKSWTGKAASAPGKPNRPVRSFVIEVSCFLHHT